MYNTTLSNCNKSIHSLIVKKIIFYETELRSPLTTTLDQSVQSWLNVTSPIIEAVGDIKHPGPDDGERS